MILLKNLSDDDLHQSAIEAARRDQAATRVTIEHLEEVARRFLHAKRGYSSLQDYAENALGFSGPAAAERIAAMRLAVAVPETREKLQSGALSLSSAVAVQRFIYREEKASDRRFTPEEKSRMVEQVSGCSVEQTKKELLAFAVSPEPHLLREKVRPVTPTRTELCFYVNPEFMGELERVRELKGGLSLEDIFTDALAAYLGRIDPGRRRERGKGTVQVQHKITPPANGASRVDESRRGSGNWPSMNELPGCPEPMGNERSQSIRMSESGAALDTRYVRMRDQRSLLTRSGGRCEFVDRKTGRRCGSRYRLQTDHRIPWALGGPTKLENLRHLCRAHNTLSAVEVFGMRKMRPFLRD